METWVLILVVNSSSGGASIERVPGIPTRQECELAGNTLRATANGPFVGTNLHTYCVRSREVVQPSPTVERK